MQTGRVHVLLQKLPPLAPLSDRARPSLLSYLYLVSVGFASVLSDLIFRLPPFAVSVSVSVSGRSSVSGCSPRYYDRYNKKPAKNANHGRRGMGFSLPPRELGAADAHHTTTNRSTTTIAAHALIFATQNHRSTRPRSHTRNTALSAETTRAAHRPQRQLHEQTSYRSQRQLHEQTTTPVAETTA